MLPNWIIAGVPKAGTTSVFRWLSDHPQAAGASEKETYYFLDAGSHMFRPQSNWRDHGTAGYERLFAGCNPDARVVLESTPGYIYSETALSELPSLPTKPRFIFMLREPSAQIRSLFTYFQQNWNWVPRGMSFAEFIDAVEQASCKFNGNELAAHALDHAWYPSHLRRWRAAVGAERMHVLLFEDLVAESRAVMQRLAALMNIDPAFYDDYAFPQENATYEVRNAAIQDFNIWLRARLPKGRVYNALRSLYRKLNTRAPAALDGDAEVQAQLAERYRPMWAELERDFGLDLARWRHAVPGGGKELAPPSVATQQPQRAPAKRALAR